LVDLLADVEGVQLRHLPPLTTVLVRTMKSVYRVVITQWPEVYVHGGAFFSEPTRAYLDGASLGGNCLEVGWIVVGRLADGDPLGRPAHRHLACVCHLH
jgi:hypothetical protein